MSGGVGVGTVWTIPVDAGMPVPRRLLRQPTVTALPRDARPRRARRERIPVQLRLHGAAPRSADGTARRRG